MYSMIQRYTVQVLRQGGLTRERIHELTGISERSISRMGGEPEIVPGDDEVSVRKVSKVGAPSKVAASRDLIVRLLTDKPDMTSVEIIHQMKTDGYEGKPSAAFAFIAKLRKASRDFVMRFEGLPGEFTQHDFGEVIVQFTDGRRKKIHFFATRLKYSRWVEVNIVPNQNAETLVRAMLRHFAAIGGIPLLAVFDRPKTVAVKWRSDGTVTQWNKTFGDAVLRLGLGVELCWPYSPEQKGSVENLVKWVKGSFFKQRRFVDYDDLQMQLEDWVREVNTETRCRATGLIPSQRIEADRRRLRPLKTAPEDFDLRFQAVVRPTAEVFFEGGIYTMPPASIGMAADLHVYIDKVRVVAGTHEALHDRQAPGSRSILPQHRPQQLAEVRGKRGKRYLRREHILQLGDDAELYVTELVHRRPDRWHTDTDRIHDLLQRHGDDMVLDAIRRAQRNQTYGGEYIAAMVAELQAQSGPMP